MNRPNRLHRLNRQRSSLTVAIAGLLLAFVVAVGGFLAPVADAHPVAVAPSVTQPKKVVSSTKSRKIKKRATTTAVKPKGKKKKKTTTTRPKVTVAATTVATTNPATTVAPVPLPTDPATTVIPGTVAPVPVGSTVAATTTTTRPGPTTTLPAAAVPAPANPPTRATAATIDPYRGVGTWVDRFDWTQRWSGKANPPVSAATVDAMAAQGIQTIYIQAAHWSTSPDVLEPERLIAIIDRAHQLGMYVVVWYLPFFQDVNTDLRKTVALANLDVDGINIDIEERSGVVNVAERNARLLQYSQSLRALLPGRAIGNNIVATTLLDGAPNYYPPLSGQPKANALWWGGPFPYKEIAPFYDIWMIQAYWTDRAADSGWRDGYRYTVDNVNRLRANVGRPDLPVQVIGGLGGARLTLNEFSGFLQASREVGSVGISFYDWMITPYAWLPYMWSFRWTPDGSLDPRFPVTPAPAYVEQPRPAPTTTTLPPPTVPGTVPLTTIPVSVPPPTPSPA